MCHGFKKYFYAKIKDVLGTIAFPQDFHEWSLPENGAVLLHGHSEALETRSPM